MFNNLVSYKVDLPTKFKLRDVSYDDLNKLIITSIRTELHAHSSIDRNGNIRFETDFWRTKMFHPEIGLFNLTIDAGLIKKIERDNYYSVRIRLSFIRLLTMLYALIFIALLVGFIYGDLKILSVFTLVLIIIPALIIYPLSILGARVFVSKLEKIL